MHDKNRAMEVIEFVQMLSLVGDFYGQPFTLLDWQHSLLWDVYGTVNENGLRQYRKAYLEVPKKNGKSPLIAALSIYHLCMDAPEGEVYCCAVDRAQAAIVYRYAVSMIEQCPPLLKILKITDSRKEIRNIHTGTIMKVLSSEVRAKHGVAPTVIIFDELHAQPNRDLWDVMTFGSGSARKEPLLWVITTAGDDPDRHSVGWEQHEYAKNVRDGNLIDPTCYARIYGASEDADIYDEKVWYDANPSLGKAITIETVRQEALQARNSESAEKLFRWLRLNQWVSLKRTGWLPLSVWDATEGNWSIDELNGCKCYAGLDLSSTTDLTGLCLLFPAQKGWTSWRAIFEAWIPDENIAERVRRDKAPFDKWVKEKKINATPGNIIDYDFIKSRLVTMSTLYKIQHIGYDPFNSSQLVNDLVKGIEFDGKLYKFSMIEVTQMIRGLSPPMKELEIMLAKKTLTHENNPVARWCFGNVVVYTDGNENLKPMKNKSHERIDLTLALIDAMAIAMKFENTKIICPYSKERGIIVL